MAPEIGLEERSAQAFVTQFSAVTPTVTIKHVQTLFYLPLEEGSNLPPFEDPGSDNRSLQYRLKKFSKNFVRSSVKERAPRLMNACLPGKANR